MLAACAFDGDTLHSGQRVVSPDQIVSSNGAARLQIQGDGNLCVVDIPSQQTLWKSNSFSRSTTSTHLEMQTDGNLVWYGNGNTGVLWATNTSSGKRLIMQDDCNLVLYDDGNGVAWASYSTCSPGPAPAPPGPSPGPRVPTMNDFWQNQAHFEPLSHARFEEYGMTAMNVGFQFVTRPGGVWYIFHREYHFVDSPDYCGCKSPAKDCLSRQVVRKSNNEGKNWSDPVPIAQPVENAPDECGLTDGGAYFDSETGTWHYMSQCINRHGGWNMCHYSRNGEDPMAGGLWQRNPHNPVVRSNQLWGQICKSSANCFKDTHDEGTPEIVQKDSDGYFYVTFHGLSNNHGKDKTKAVRGVAKTKDFVQWETSGANLPGDAIFGQVDCKSWSPPGGWDKGCAGGGGATILRDGDYMYHLIEAPDGDLSCNGPGQNWDLGLLRSKTFAPAGAWEQFTPSMPLVIPEQKIGCFIQYHKLFSDDQGTYLEYWAGTNNDGWMQILKLTPGPGSLPIVATEKVGYYRSNSTSNTTPMDVADTIV